MLGTVVTCTIATNYLVTTFLKLLECLIKNARNSFSTWTSGKGGGKDSMNDADGSIIARYVPN